VSERDRERESERDKKRDRMSKGVEGGEGRWERMSTFSSRSTYMMLVSSSLPRTSSRS
jgi:hypothetical protein